MFIDKIFGPKKLKSSTSLQPKHGPYSNTAAAPSAAQTAALKIIHAGGLAEHYYMAIPASSILEKNPSFVLTTPDIFRRPWEPLVRPEDILIPGQKYLVVPKHTLRKLRRRISKSSLVIHKSSLSFTSQNDVSRKHDSFSSSSSLQPLKNNTTSIMAKPSTARSIKSHTRRVRFFGMDSKQQPQPNVSSDRNERKQRLDEQNSRSAGEERKKMERRVRFAWQPSLTVITENHGAPIEN